MNPSEFNKHFKRLENIFRTGKELPAETRDEYYDQLKDLDAGLVKDAITRILDDPNITKIPFPAMIRDIAVTGSQYRSITDKDLMAHLENCHCERCQDTGHILKKVRYPKLSKTLIYSVAMPCPGCEAGRRVKVRWERLEAKSPSARHKMEIVEDDAPY